MPDDLAALSGYLWQLSFCADNYVGEYLAEAKHYGASVRSKALPYTHWKAKPGEIAMTDAFFDRSRLRVGFVSGDIKTHAVGYFLEGVVLNLNPAKVELIAYSMNPNDDGLTERIRPGFAEWTTIVGMSDEEAARKIHEDGIDILIDLSGHSGLNRLPVFAWKPAPIQVSWLGYLASTGVPGIDYVLADRIAVPEENRWQFTEQVWYLPETFNCFTPPPDNIKLKVEPAPVLRQGYITFGSYQRMNKLSGETLALWGRIFKALPTARLCLRNGFMKTANIHELLLQRLDSAGIARHRVTLAHGIESHEDHLATYAQVDIVLDTCAYPGVTTTCEALWMGVPTVTLAGETMLGRIGASLLTGVGLSGWVAQSEEEYVELAVRHASDVEGLARLRAELRERVRQTPLFDAGRFAPQLEDALLGMWQRRDNVTGQAR